MTLTENRVDNVSNIYIMKIENKCTIKFEVGSILKNLKHQSSKQCEQIVIGMMYTIISDKDEATFLPTTCKNLN